MCSERIYLRKMQWNMMTQKYCVRAHKLYANKTEHRKWSRKETLLLTKYWGSHTSMRAILIIALIDDFSGLSISSQCPKCECDSHMWVWGNKYKFISVTADSKFLFYFFAKTHSTSLQWHKMSYTIEQKQIEHRWQFVKHVFFACFKHIYMFHIHICCTLDATLIAQNTINISFVFFFWMEFCFSCDKFFDNTAKSELKKTLKTLASKIFSFPW